MKMKILVKHIPVAITAAVLGVSVAAGTLGATFGFALLMQRYHPQQAEAIKPPSGPPAAALVEQGRHLFLQNCAHCHGDDATGDEGPDLHGVTKSDARIAAIILKGIKGEMPKFGAKLKDDDVRALTAFIRSLKE